MFASLNDFPAHVNRYLLPYEQQTITLRFHPAILFGPILVVLAGLAGAGAASSYLTSSPDAVTAIWITWGLLLLYLVGRVVRWLNDLFVVTTERLLVVKGILTRDVASVPLARAIGMRLRRSPMGAVFGYGHLIFEAGGQDQAIRAVKFVPYPEQLHLEICSMIYPNRDQRQRREPDTS
jgi:membrane protein YdbS with pleckstrin-like domain